jgi:hypothetical protein
MWLFFPALFIGRQDSNDFCIPKVRYVVSAMLRVQSPESRRIYMAAVGGQFQDTITGL